MVKGSDSIGVRDSIHVLFVTSGSGRHDDKKREGRSVLSATAAHPNRAVAFLECASVLAL